MHSGIDNKPIISLWGMPGSGKSYWGRIIADQMKYDFVDLDTEIQKSESAEISDIIAQKGEAFFRNIESTVLNDLLNRIKNGCILSTGGGTPCFPNNLRLLKEKTFSIYLKVADNLLAQNLKDEYHKRPLFAVKDDLLSQIISLKAEREAFYDQADAILEAPLNVEKFKSVIPR